jgi:hypothetical protein
MTTFAPLCKAIKRPCGFSVSIAVVAGILISGISRRKMAITLSESSKELFVSTLQNLFFGIEIGVSG